MSYEVFKEKKFNFTYECEGGLVHSLSIEEIKKVSAFLHKNMV